jgi:RNA polymerase sigma-70 factor (ECF subfamily)
MTQTRTNDEWISDLAQSGPRRDQALADLRLILRRGLERGLIGQVDTSAPEFGTQADDFVQEAMLKVLDNLDSFAGRSQFTTWAHKITLNIALTELRRKRWKDTSLEQLTETETGEYTPSFAADPAAQPEQLTERRELMAYVSRLIADELTDKQRTALLGVLAGMPMAEVAERLGSNQNALYKLLFDARQRLKRRMADDGLTPEDVMASFAEPKKPA